MKNNAQTTDFDDSAQEFLNEYLSQKFLNEELRRVSFAETISFIRAGFFLGIKFVKIFYNIQKK